MLPPPGLRGLAYVAALASQERSLWRLVTRIAVDCKAFRSRIAPRVFSQLGACCRALRRLTFLSGPPYVHMDTQEHRVTGEASSFSGPLMWTDRLSTGLPWLPGLPSKCEIGAGIRTPAFQDSVLADGVPVALRDGSRLDKALLLLRADVLAYLGDVESGAANTSGSV